MSGPGGRVGGLGLAALLVVAACGASASPAPPSGQGAGSTSAAVAPVSSNGLLRGVRLPSGIGPGGLDEDRFAYSDTHGAAVMNLDTGEITRIPVPPRGLVFRPTGISGNIVIGVVSGAVGLDPQASEAMAFDIAGQSWLDIAARLPAGHVSTAIATDATSVVGMDLGSPGAQGAGRPYVFDIPSGVATGIPNLADGAVPVPHGIGGGHMVGAEATGRGGWLWDQASSSFTMLATAAGSDRAEPRAVSDTTVVGILAGQTRANDSPFAYDVATKALTDLGLPGFGAEDLSGHLVLLSAEDAWAGWLRNLDTGAATSFDTVDVDGTSVAVRPWAMSDGWVVGFTAPPQGSAARIGSVVAISIGEGP